MATYQLFFQEQAKVYFLYIPKDQFPICKGCKKELKITGLLIWEYFKNKFNSSTYCTNCIDKKPRAIGSVTELKVFHITNIIPEYSIVVKPNMKLITGKGDDSFSYTQVSVFDKATQNDGASITNNCKVAFNEDRNIQIESKEIKPEQILYNEEQVSNYLKKAKKESGEK